MTLKEDARMDAEPSRRATKGDLLSRRVVVSRRAAALAAMVMLAATLARLLTLSLPAQRLGGEIGLGALGALYAAVSVRLLRPHIRPPSLLVIVQGPDS